MTRKGQPAWTSTNVELAGRGYRFKANLLKGVATPGNDNMGLPKPRDMRWWLPGIKIILVPAPGASLPGARSQCPQTLARAPIDPEIRQHRQIVRAVVVIGDDHSPGRMCHGTEAAHQCLGFQCSMDVIQHGPVDLHLAQARVG